MYPPFHRTPTQPPLYHTTPTNPPHPSTHPTQAHTDALQPFAGPHPNPSQGTHPCTEQPRTRQPLHGTRECWRGQLWGGWVRKFEFTLGAVAVRRVGVPITSLPELFLRTNRLMLNFAKTFLQPKCVKTRVALRLEWYFCLHLDLS